MNRSWACLFAVSLLSCLCCPRLLHSSLLTWLITLWLKFVLCSSHRHRHVSCARWVTLSPSSPSFSLSSLHSLYLPALPTAFHLPLDVVYHKLGLPGQEELLHKAKPRRPTSTCSSTRTVPIRERRWINIEPGAQSHQAYPVAKRLHTLVRHGELPREEGGAIEVWRLKNDLRNKFEHSQCWSDEMWKSKMAGGEGNKKRFQYCIESSGQEILYLRALQGHSERNPIDPTLLDNVSTLNKIFECIYHVGCAINLHTIINSGLILGSQNLSNRQTVFILAVDRMDKNHKDPDTIDLHEPRHALFMNKAWKKTSKQWIRSTSTLLWGKDWSSIRLERMQSFFKKHSQLTVSRKLLGWKLERSYTKNMHVTSASSKDLPGARLGWRIGFRRCSTTRRTSCATLQKFPTEPTNSKPRSW